jgi:peptidoglycan/xylan/chitin deacetylase (PgdA/CDA1 family)
MNWLLPIQSALDSAAKPVNFFFRDDDAGWNNAELLVLLDLFESHEVPLDVAVIPRSINQATLNLILPRLKRSPHLLAAHQHGYEHVNHEQTGRKCEFGNARSLDQQQTDIRAGKFLFEQAFGGPSVSIFTPPWNRCTETTAHCLREAGFQVLSRDLTATPLLAPGLRELPISIDWFAKHKGNRVTFQELGTQTANAIRTQPQVGIMLHHAVMDQSEFQQLDNLLSLLTTHPKVSCRLMQDIVVLHEFSSRELATAAANVGQRSQEEDKRDGSYFYVNKPTTGHLQYRERSDRKST